MQTSQQDKKITSRKEVEAMYDASAKEYDSGFSSQSHKDEDKAVARQLRELSLEMKWGEVVLDLGCGTGHFLRLLPTDRDSYVGIDISSGMLDKAREDFPGHKFFQAPIEEVYSLMGESSCDAIVCLYGGVSYVADLEPAMKGIAKALKPDGKIFLMFYSPSRAVSEDLFTAAAGIVPNSHSSESLKDIAVRAGLKSPRVYGAFGYQNPFGSLENMSKYLILESCGKNCA